MVYRNTNEKIERFTEFYGCVLGVTDIIYTLIPLIYSIVSYYILDSGRESFFLFSPTWLLKLIKIDETPLKKLNM